MKRLLITSLLTMFMTGCTFSNDYGNCVGVVDTKHPGLEYEMYVPNLVVTFIFGASVLVPLITVTKALECPVGYKK